MKNIPALIRKAPFAFALLIVCTAAIFSFALDAWFLPTQGTLLILQLAVVITALLGNKQSAIFAGVLSGLIFNYFFTIPRFSLHMANVHDIVNLSIFLIVAVLTGFMAEFYKAKQEALERAELRASILMSVSHDLRTPLSTIIGSLGTLKEYQHRLPAQEREELLQGALEESHRLHRYIENLLQATKLHQGIKLNSVNQALLPLVNNVIKRFENERITIEQADMIPNITASGYLLEQAIYNVVDNALRYSPSECSVMLRFAVEDSLVHLDVVDEGPGIGGDQKEAVFALFFSTRTGDSGYGGSGIGLTVAKGIIEAHHGRISILPSTKGCTVRISLPSVGNE
ncbi:sensor histidine kinase [Alteromonas sp. 14N.309.X.WAT.G.H12]|uniref:sensor histidine kinase n=1 Tax=Alteromonas sp. 14N.309.X.WAT.G.H12 TaxID=3120824 RepID=UPI002FD48C64